MANTYVETEINGIKVWCDVYYERYVPANINGHPDSWTPAEGGELEVETCYVQRKGMALVNCEWVDCDLVELDILPLLSHDEIELLTDKCYESLNSAED